MSWLQPKRLADSPPYFRRFQRFSSTSRLGILRWLSGQWYRLPAILIAPGFIGIPLLGTLLASIQHSDQPHRIAALTGMVAGVSLASVHSAISLCTASRIPTLLRIAAAIFIPTLATTLSWLWPPWPAGANTKIPLALGLYSSCIGCIATSVVLRSLSQKELVGRRMAVFSRTGPSADPLLIAAALLFAWSQFQQLDRQWLRPVNNMTTLAWSFIAGAAGAWALLARTRFQESRIGLAPALPVFAVATYLFCVELSRTIDHPSFWSIVTVTQLVGIVSWLISQELLGRLAQVSGWRWRDCPAAAHEDVKPETRFSPQAHRWLALGGLYLVAAACLSLYALSIRTRLPFDLPTLYALFVGVSAGVSLASLTSFCVLAAHQLRHPVSLSILLTAVILSLSSIVAERTLDQVRLAMLILPIPIAMFVQLLIRAFDWMRQPNVNPTRPDKSPVTIRELMALTLILSIEFAILRVSQIPWPVVISVLGWTVLPVALSLVCYRCLLFGATKENVLASIVGGLTVMILVTQFGGYLDPTLLILIVTFAASHVVIARLLGRNQPFAMVNFAERSAFGGW